MTGPHQLQLPGHWNSYGGACPLGTRPEGHWQAVLLGHLARDLSDLIGHRHPARDLIGHRHLVRDLIGHRLHIRDLNWIS